MAVTNFEMEEGEHLARSPNKPIISVVGSDEGGLPYLWVGNDAEGDGMCFASLSGNRELRKLANAILAELPKEK
jgi:hypothetical protein